MSCRTSNWLPSCSLALKTSTDKLLLLSSVFGGLAHSTHLVFKLAPAYLALTIGINNSSIFDMMFRRELNGNDSDILVIALIGAISVGVTAGLSVILYTYYCSSGKHDEERQNQILNPNSLVHRVPIDHYNGSATVESINVQPSIQMKSHQSAFPTDMTMSSDKFRNQLEMYYSKWTQESMSIKEIDMAMDMYARDQTGREFLDRELKLQFGQSLNEFFLEPKDHRKSTRSSVRRFKGEYREMKLDEKESLRAALEGRDIGRLFPMLEQNDVCSIQQLCELDREYLAAICDDEEEIQALTQLAEASELLLHAVNNPKV